MSTKYITITEDDKEIIKKSSLSVGVDRCHLLGFYIDMCFLEFRYLGDNNDWFSSLSDIEDYSGVRQKQITDYIKCLEELGLLRVVRNKYSKETGKRTEVNHYKILGSTMNHSDKESKPQAAEKPRGKKLKEQPEQANKAIETKVDEWERAAYCVGNDDEFDSIISEDMGVYNDEPEKDSNPNPPKTNDKAIESQPEVKAETPTPHIVNSGLPDDRASKAVFIMYDNGMKESEWLRALGSRSRRQINLCRGPYMAYLSQDERDYLDDYIDNILKAA